MSRAIVTNRYRHEQTTSSTTWNVAHNLNVTSPIVDVWIQELSVPPYVNSDAYQVTRVDANNLTIEFMTSKTGIALII